MTDWRGATAVVGSFMLMAAVACSGDAPAPPGAIVETGTPVLSPTIIPTYSPDQIATRFADPNLDPDALIITTGVDAAALCATLEQNAPGYTVKLPNADDLLQGIRSGSLRSRGDGKEWVFAIVVETGYPDIFLLDTSTGLFVQHQPGGRYVRGVDDDVVAPFRCAYIDQLTGETKYAANAMSQEGLIES